MTFDYRYLIDKSVLDVLKRILADIQSSGIVGDQSFYISFRTDAGGVVLSKTVKQKYPKEITIVLQHQFKQLKVFDEKFTVNITFSGAAENLEIPFSAITSFFDPVTNFGFQFASKKNPDNSQDHLTTKADILPSEFKFVKRKRDKITNEAKIVSLDKFREKREEKNKI